MFSSNRKAKSEGPMRKRTNSWGPLFRLQRPLLFHTCIVTFEMYYNYLYLTKNLRKICSRSMRRRHKSEPCKNGPKSLWPHSHLQQWVPLTRGTFMLRIDAEHPYMGLSWRLISIVGFISVLLGLTLAADHAAYDYDHSSLFR